MQSSVTGVRLGGAFVRFTDHLYHTIILSFSVMLQIYIILNKSDDISI